MYVCRVIHMHTHPHNRSEVATFAPLQEYIKTFNPQYINRECWAWVPCGKDEYVEQLPVDDGLGYLVKPLVCKTLSRARSGAQYLLVDGSRTRYLYILHTWEII